MRLRVSLLATVVLLGLGRVYGTAAEPLAGGAAPDFKEVYDLVRAHLPGLNEAELNRSAVEALLSALGPKVDLIEPQAATQSPLASDSRLFDGPVVFIRVKRVNAALAKALDEAYRHLAPSNQALGLVLDLRYAEGHDYSAAADTADLFLTKQRPLLNWGTGLVQSKPDPNPISVPITVLVNERTTGAAEALAAVLRQTGVGLLLGSRTAGQAMTGEEYRLSNGGRLRIATAPVLLGDGSALSEQGVAPDINVEVSPADERAYFADAFKELSRTNALAAADSVSTNQLSATNHLRRVRFNEAELVRERREGVNPDVQLTTSGPDDSQKPVVRDPVLARALDVLKGLAVVRQSRS